MDPLLHYLEKRLTGITIHSSPIFGPPYLGESMKRKYIDYKYKLAGYCDDVKPALTNINEFKILDKGVKLFESSSGCELHRDLISEKCKILLLGEWRKWHQKDIPLNYLSKSEIIDMLGVKLYYNYTKTRQENGVIAIDKVKKKINTWKSGKYLPLTDRTHSVNTFILSKLWYKMGSIEFQKSDIKK